MKKKQIKAILLKIDGAEYEEWHESPFMVPTMALNHFCHKASVTVGQLVHMVVIFDDGTRDASTFGIGPYPYPL